MMEDETKEEPETCEQAEEGKKDVDEEDRDNEVEMKDESETCEQAEEKKEDEEDNMEEDSTPHSSSQKPAIPSPIPEKMKDVDEHIEKVKSIIAELKKILERTEVKTDSRAVAWKKDVDELEKASNVPYTTIAVVGATGSGKSTMMNALLDHAVLPTSCMEACTAVVVQITHNTEPYYDAEIDFLTKEEWSSELKALLAELKDKEGKIKMYKRDRNTDAGVAWSKVCAVYGSVPGGITEEILHCKTDITERLGSVMKIRDTCAESFRRKLDEYIASDKQTLGGEFWPIIKQVRLFLPACSVCESGAILVDLPGTRDSNAARDRVAKQFLKNCSAVWVAAEIHRAIDDKTAKKLLGEHFRQQLLMDGQYGSVSFVCTKTDNIQPSEAIGKLRMEEEIKPLKSVISSLSIQTEALAEDVTDLAMKLKQHKDILSKLHVHDEKQQFENDLVEVEGLSSQMADLEDNMSFKQNKISAVEEKIEHCQEEINRRKMQQLELEQTTLSKRKEIIALCSQRRNDHIKQGIEKDFRMGLRDLKRQAKMGEGADEEEDEDEDEEEEMAAVAEDKDSNEEETLENLRVFCVSAVEYLKLRGKLPMDGNAQVFSTTEETGIPGLQRYVHKVTHMRKATATERLLERLAHFLAAMEHILQDEGTEDCKIRQEARGAFEEHAKHAKGKLIPVVDKASEEIDKLLVDHLEPKVKEGAQRATRKADAIMAKRADKQKDYPEQGGLHPKTYKAVVNHEGVYSSYTRKSPIDFNQDLASPMFSSITVVWDQVFNSKFPDIFSRCKLGCLRELKVLAKCMQAELLKMGVSAERVERAYIQHIQAADTKLTTRLDELTNDIQERLRKIHRGITPAIKDRMCPVYREAAKERGTGSIIRMKAKVKDQVAEKKLNMFDDTSNILVQELKKLPHKVARLHEICRELVMDLRALYEPLWEDPRKTMLLRDAILIDVQRLLQRVSSARSRDSSMEIANICSKVIATTSSRNSLDSSLERTSTSSQKSSSNKLVMKGRTQESVSRTISAAATSTSSLDSSIERASTSSKVKPSPTGTEESNLLKPQLERTWLPSTTQAGTKIDSTPLLTKIKIEDAPSLGSRKRKKPTEAPIDLTADSSGSERDNSQKKYKK